MNEFATPYLIASSTVEQWIRQLTITLNDRYPSYLFAYGAKDKHHRVLLTHSLVEGELPQEAKRSLMIWADGFIAALHVTGQ